jgi:ABC-type amino acid transport substrate-binding protein
MAVFRDSGEHSFSLIINSFAFVQPALTFKKLYLAVSRSNKNAQTIINDFNQAIAEMQQDGSYDQIVSHYKY